MNFSSHEIDEIHIEDEEQMARIRGTYSEHRLPIEVSQKHLLMERNTNFKQFGVIASVGDTAAMNESHSSTEFVDNVLPGKLGNLNQERLSSKLNPVQIFK